MTELSGQGPVGIVPAAGRAMRISPLPCSKEIFPVGFFHHPNATDTTLRPRPVCDYLLEQMRAGGAERIFVVIGSGKWDIMATLGDGGRVGMPLSYIVIDDSPGPVATVAHAAPFVEDDIVLFGFPDIISEPRDVFEPLLRRQRESGAEVVLGLFPADLPHKADMVDVDADGRVRNILVKPAATDLRLTWISAVWTPPFTAFLREVAGGDGVPGGSAHVGQAIHAAVGEGCHVDSVMFRDGSYIDIGTPEELVRGVQLFSSGGSDTRGWRIP